MLQIYKEVDLLNAYIVPVDLTIEQPLLAIDFEYIHSKVVCLTLSGSHNCIVQPILIQHN